MSFDFSKVKDHALTRPRDEAWSNWKSWKDAKIGDGVEGFVADAFYRPEEKNDDGSIAFRAQRGITIKQNEGGLINVGIKDLSFVLASTDNLRVGDPIRVELTKILPATKRGQQGAKVFSYYGTNLPENAGAPTVKKLTDEDRASGGTKSSEAVDHDGEDNGSAEADAKLDALAADVVRDK